MCCYGNCLVFDCCFLVNDILQGSVVTHLRRGGIYGNWLLHILFDRDSKRNRKSAIFDKVKAYGKIVAFWCTLLTKPMIRLPREAERIRSKLRTKLCF